MSGRSRRHSEIAVAVDAGRRNESGEAIEQLQRRQAQRAGPAGARFGALVEPALGIEFAQLFQGERWPGAIAQQPLASGTVKTFGQMRRSRRKATTSAPRIS